MTALLDPNWLVEQDANIIVVGISDMQVSDVPEACLTTYALSSCIAVVIHDPVRQVGGMIHYALPTCLRNPPKGKRRPAMFADSGVPALFRSMYEFGCRKKDLVVKVAGGGHHHDTHGTFNIGRKNYVYLRKLLWHNSVLIAAEDVGGQKTRTVSLHVGSGLVTITQPGKRETNL